MQMEDDVLTIPGYLNVIKQFIAISERSLSVVQFKSESKVLKIYVAFVLRTVGIPIVRYPKIGNKLNMTGIFPYKITSINIYRLTLILEK
jgi:hypothetical protein